MDMMHGIVYPGPISMFPETLGWQLLGAWFLTCVLLILIDQVRRYRANRYRREAIRLVSRLNVELPNTAAKIATLVKRTAIAAFPREEVASLTGKDWQAFLEQSAARKLSLEEVEVLASAAYDPGVSAKKAQSAAIKWIRLHHA